jgi:predicted nucleotidyltransferase
MENTAIFEHKVSKGSRFNQIYIPTSMSHMFEVGDVVKVKLIRKKEQIYYSKSLNHLGEFKLNLIKNIFSILSKFSEIKRIFVVGSFLTQKTDYNDLDIIVISNKNELEEKACSALDEKLPFKFHILAISEKSFENLIRIDPLIRSMLYYFISNKKFELSKNTEIDKKHIEFLLMMPEDLLKTKVFSGRAYYDSLRRIIAIRRFVSRSNINPLQVDQELKLFLGKDFYDFLKSNESMDNKSMNKARRMINKQLSLIRKNLDNRK